MPKVICTKTTTVTFSKSKAGGERRRTTVPKGLGVKDKDKLFWVILDDGSAFVSIFKRRDGLD